MTPPPDMMIPFIQGGIAMMLMTSPLIVNAPYTIEQWADDEGNYEPFIRIWFDSGQHYRLVVESSGD